MKEYKYKINGLKFNITVGDVIDNQVEVEVNGVAYKVEIEKGTPIGPIKQKPAISQSGKTAGISGAVTSSTPAPAPRPATSNSADAVKAPLPGTIMSFNVKVGDTVNTGQTVCVLEAMKMENDVKTMKAGTVKQILVNVGDAVPEGSDIMIIE
ncbi:MAG: biotin/lipoyl-binding protein [Muribaculaceae bacterium]|nr:biotin/lipoyl-binding protein [Muribaculaceae bacterium]